MAERSDKSAGVVTLDVESNVQTVEGRVFLKQLNEVSHVLHLKDTEVRFKGEVILKADYVGDCKSVILYKCPRGYFLFCDKVFGKTNWSAIGSTLPELLEKVQDEAIRKRIEEEVSAKEGIAA